MMSDWRRKLSKLGNGSAWKRKFSDVRGKAVEQLLLRSPLRRVPSWVVGAATSGRGMAPVLMYHAVETKAQTNPFVSGQIHRVSPAAFRDQVSLLRELYTVVSVDELAERRRSKKSIDGLAAITFDDGYASVLANALPILEDLGLPATLFVNTKLLQGGTLWRDKVRLVINQGWVEPFLRFACERDPSFNQIRAADFYSDTKDPTLLNSRVVDELLEEFLAGRLDEENAPRRGLYCTVDDLASSASGLLDIGNHTHSHYVLSALSRREQKADIDKASRVLQAAGLSRSDVFSIPFGGAHAFDRHTLSILKEMSFKGYLTSSTRQAVDARTPVPEAPTHDDLTGLTRFMPADENPWFLFVN